jgi:hypothetical protein
MARARNIKPSFFMNEVLGDLDPLVRLLFIGLWCQADREGRLEDRPKRIKQAALCYDNCDVDELLNELMKNKFIERYSVGDENYIQICKFALHQNPHHKEAPSIIPPPPNHEYTTGNADTTTKDQRARIFKRDGNKCVKCGSIHNLTIDHIMPLSKGGENDDSNLQTLCKNCNCSKKDSIMGQACVNHGSSMERVGSASRADSLNPHPLTLIPITDSLKPITDSLPPPTTNVFTFFSQNIGLIGKHQTEVISSYLDDGMEEEMLIESIKDSIGKDSPWKYLEAVLKNAFNRKILTYDNYMASKSSFKKGEVKEEDLPESTKTYRELKRRMEAGEPLV